MSTLYVKLGDEDRVLLDKLAAADVTQASKTKMLGSLISGAGGVADKWLQYQTNFGKSGSSGGSSPVYPPDDI